MIWFVFNKTFDIIPVLWVLAITMLLFPSSKAFYMLIAASLINFQHHPCGQLCHHNCSAIPLTVVIGLMDYNQDFDPRAALQQQSMLSMANCIILNPYLANCQHFISLDHCIAFCLFNHNTLLRGLQPFVGISGTSIRTAFYCTFKSCIRFYCKSDVFSLWRAILEEICIGLSFLHCFLLFGALFLEMQLFLYIIQFKLTTASQPVLLQLGTSGT